MFALFVPFVVFALFVLLYASGHNFALLGNESSFRFVASSTALNAARERAPFTGKTFPSFPSFVSFLHCLRF